MIIIQLFTSYSLTAGDVYSSPLPAESYNNIHYVHGGNREIHSNSCINAVLHRLDVYIIYEGTLKSMLLFSAGQKKNVVPFNQ